MFRLCALRKYFWQKKNNPFIHFSTRIERMTLVTQVDQCSVSEMTCALSCTVFAFLTNNSSIALNVLIISLKGIICPFVVVLHFEGTRVVTYVPSSVIKLLLRVGHPGRWMIQSRSD